MSAAEARVRLREALRLHPDLLADATGQISPSVGGEGSRAPSRELRPLPLPKYVAIRQDQYATSFPQNGGLSEEARKLGADAWQHLVISALNGLDSHGMCASFFGPATPAQSQALSDLYDQCQRFVKDGKPRTPVDFKRELGAKMHSYWGEPVYTAVELPLA
mgnify:CR=1 FL=1